MVGSFIADARASRAAEFYEVVPQDSTDILWYYSVVRRIQARAIAILADVLPHRPVSAKIERVKRPPTTPLGVAVLNSKHRFTFFAGTARCYVCHERAPLVRSHLLDWLRSPCKVDPIMANAYFTGTSRPARLPTHRPIPVGRRVAHASHDLLVHKGLVFCGKCGYYAHHRLLRLAEQCTGMKDERAIARVRRLRAGKLPTGVSDWPNSYSRTLICLSV